MLPIDPVRYSEIVIALGGNTLIRPGKEDTVEEQYTRIGQAMAAAADMLTAAPIIIPFLA